MPTMEPTSPDEPVQQSVPPEAAAAGHDPAPPMPDLPAKPCWGPWATIGLGLLVCGLYFIIQTVVLFGAAFGVGWSDPSLGAEGVERCVSNNGLVLSTAMLLSIPPCLGIIFLFVWLRKGPPFTEYIGLVPVRGGILALWLAVAVLFIAASDGTSTLLGKPVVPPFLYDAYKTGSPVVLLWIAFVLFVPVFEEVFFRGFLFEGFRNSVIGNMGAVVLCALLWAGAHVQYEPYEMATVFVGGLLLGVSRVHTGSLVPAIVVHAVINTVALLEVVWTLDRAL